MNTSSLQNDFLTFLGYCLSPDSQALPECAARICWAHLLQFAKKQSVVGVYWQGVKRMSVLETNRPSEDDVMDWMGAYTKIVRRNVKTDDAVAKLTKIMRDNGIAFFVFKGQVIASYYPSPEMRTSGDVDFYVFRKDWGRAKSLLEKDVTMTDDHSDFLKEGIALRQFIDWMMFFEAKHKEIVLPELTAKLDKLGLLSAFKAFGAVLTEVLGMDAACLPYSLTESDKHYVDKIMTIVLRYGNFGKYGRKEQQGGWKHSVETGMRAVRHITQFFWLSPAENLLWIPKLICRSLMKNAIHSN